MNPQPAHLAGVRWISSPSLPFPPSVSPLSRTVGFLESSRMRLAMCLFQVTSLIVSPGASREGLISE